MDCAVRLPRPERRDVRPGKRDAPAISQPLRRIARANMRSQGNGVSYTLGQTRKSQEQTLKRASASSVADSLLIKGLPSLATEMLTALHRRVSWHIFVAHP